MSYAEAAPTDPDTETHVGCWQCGYDLHGIATDGRCPECGFAATESYQRAALLAADTRRLRSALGTLAGSLVCTAAVGPIGVVSAIPLMFFSLALIGIGVIAEYLLWARGLIRLAEVPCVGEPASQTRRRAKFAAVCGWGAFVSVSAVGVTMCLGMLTQDGRTEDAIAALILTCIVAMQVFRIAGIAVVWPVLRGAAAWRVAPDLRTTIQVVAGLGVIVAAAVGVTHAAMAAVVLNWRSLEGVASGAIVAVPASFLTGLIGAIALAVVRTRLMRLTRRATPNA